MCLYAESEQRRIPTRSGISVASPFAVIDATPRLCLFVVLIVWRERGCKGYGPYPVRRRTIIWLSCPSQEPARVIIVHVFL